jgi:hypothetical protein
MSAATSQQSGGTETFQRIKTENTSHFRWVICGLLFYATTLNYMDRQVLGLLKPTLRDPVRGIGMTEVQYAAIVSVSSAAYALGLLLAGGNIDRVGTGIGYAVALGIWTIASISQSLAGNATVTDPMHSIAARFAGRLHHIPGLANAMTLDPVSKLSGAILCFGVARFVLGLGESGNVPAVIKAVVRDHQPRLPSREDRHPDLTLSPYVLRKDRPHKLLILLSEFNTRSADLFSCELTCLSLPRAHVMCLPRKISDRLALSEHRIRKGK